MEWSGIRMKVNDIYCSYSATKTPRHKDKMDVNFAPSEKEEFIAKKIVDAAYAVHKALWPFT